MRTKQIQWTAQLDRISKRRLARNACSRWHVHGMREPGCTNVAREDVDGAGRQRTEGPRTLAAEFIARQDDQTIVAAFRNVVRAGVFLVCAARSGHLGV